MKSSASGGGAILPAGSQSRTDPAQDAAKSAERGRMPRPTRRAVRRVIRWLNRVAPRVMNFIATAIEKEMGRLPKRSAPELSRAKARPDSQKSHTAKDEFPAALPMTVGDVQFTLLRPDFGATGSRSGTSSWHRYWKLSKSGKPYEPLMLACLTRLLQRAPDPRFMDVGAFLGYYACYVSALLRQQEVSAVESNPFYAGAIGESVRANGFSQLRVFQAALSDRIESVSIEGLTVRPGGSAGMTITLDELCLRESLRPTIIKMDVHGAEGKIVFGMRKTLAKIDTMLLELHNLHFMQEYSPGITRTAMLDALEDAGLTLYYVGGHSKSNESAPDFQELITGSPFSYRRLDRQSRDLLLFDRGSDEFVLALRNEDIESVLGPSLSAPNE